MAAYYNEFDPKAAAWLRELIKAGLIAPGEVDERSIADVKADDIRGFTQCHFFAGIGGWSYALRLAGWADDRPVWTGSPPCQPFSNAGKQKAQADARHLWPVFFNLIRECRPANIFGEQVEAAIRTGWLDDLQDDLETEGYATGKIVLPACGFGAPHIRQRIWFVAERRVVDTEGSRNLRESEQKHSEIAGQERVDMHKHIGSGGLPCGLADTNGEQNNTADLRGLHTESCSEGRDGRLADTRLQRQGERQEQTAGGKQCSEISGLGNTEHAGLHGVEMLGSPIKTSNGSESRSELSGELEGTGSAVVSGALRFWENPDWLYCRDGKWRPVESSVQRMVDGLSDELVRGCNISPACNPLAKDQEARTMRLKGYGNAIVPPLAAEFIKAYMEGKEWPTSDLFRHLVKESEEKGKEDE